MQTPTPLDRFHRERSLVPTPDQRSISSPAVQRPIASSSSAHSLHRQTLAASALTRQAQLPAQTPGPGGSASQDAHMVKRDSPYRSASGPDHSLPVHRMQSSAPSPSQKPATPAPEPIRMTPSSANAIGRARASKRLRTSISTLFIFAVVTTSPPYRALLVWLDESHPHAFQTQQYLSLLFLLLYVHTLLRSIWQLAIPGAAALPVAPTVSSLDKAKQAVKAIAPNANSADGSPAAAGTGIPSQIIRSSPKTRPSLPPLDSPRAYSRSPSHSNSPQSKANAPRPAAKDSPSRSPSRSLLAERPQTPEQLRTALLSSSASSPGQGATPLDAFHARHPSYSLLSGRRVSDNLEKLKAEAALAVAG